MKKILSFTLLFGVLVFTGSYANTGSSSTQDLNAYVINDEISMLCKAAMQGDVDKVRSLLATGESVNQKSLGMTPAMYAARYNQAEVLKVLLLNQANLNMKSDQGYTVKEYAQMSGAKDVLNVLSSNF
jgi:ankyrin repeat protein